MGFNHMSSTFEAQMMAGHLRPSQFNLNLEDLWRKLQRLKAQYLDLLDEVRRQIANRAASGNQGEQERDRNLKMLRGADRAVAMLLARDPGHARSIFQNFGKSVEGFEQEVCSLMSYWLKAAPQAMGPSNRVRAMPPGALAPHLEAERLWHHLQHLLTRYLEPLTKVNGEVKAAAAAASESDPGQERALKSFKVITERMLETIMAADPDQAMALRRNFPKGLDVFEQQVEALLSTWEKRKRQGVKSRTTVEDLSVCAICEEEWGPERRRTAIIPRQEFTCGHALYCSKCLDSFFRSMREKVRVGAPVAYHCPSYCDLGPELPRLVRIHIGG
ncbi:hypothetical protein KFL_006120060 [Klebsormidium nitens]|uniref:RING-type domain-containing protein n=1 Tax=Klebsormidium nitens TaxID=105231 RepID=A0A1Y1IJA3_KLENI|nr:hypothetical protein KFL_006120060 [Klebsormidium nitens]|eukprot:GAQ90202.1 hypothetical protein KFL_006120060 [Klebsormidium nitens]